MEVTNNIFEKYIDTVIDKNRYYDFCISKNSDERINELYKTISNEVMLKSNLYYPNELYECFKKQLVKFYYLNNVNVLELGSGTESIICTINNIILKDKTVGVVTPHFYRISETIQKLVLINGEFSVNSMFVDVEYIEKYIQNYSIDAIWISNPNSIVGFGYEKESLKYLINKYPNVLFIFDETNIEFYSECDELTMISELEKNLNTVVIRSCSKFFGVPGARIGVISTYNEDIMKSYVKMNPTFPVSGSSIQFAALAFKNYSLFRNLAKDINDTKRILKKMFQKVNDINLHNSLSNIIYLTSDKYNLWDEFKARGILTMKYNDLNYKSAVRVTIHSDMLLKEILLEKISDILELRY